MKLLLIVAVLHIFLFDSHTTRVLNARATDTLTTVNIFGIRKTIKIETITISNESEEVDIEFATIPAGGFAMGSSDGDTKEKPAHRVRISKPFKISTKEVTQRLWYMVMKNLPYPYNFQKRERSCIDYNEQTNVCPHNPINFVSWYHIREFIQRLNILTNGNYRLPTEAEWEYAARAGTTTPYYFGYNEGGQSPDWDDYKLLEYGWYDGDMPYCDNDYSDETCTAEDNIPPKGSARKQFHKVATKKVNPWGLYDVYGNVSEWVSDYYGLKYYWNSPLEDPKGPYKIGRHTHRGGNIYVTSESCRSATREEFDPQVSNQSSRELGAIGFRLAQDIKDN